jgi:hypothetical protein
MGRVAGRGRRWTVVLCALLGVGVACSPAGTGPRGTNASCPVEQRPLFVLMAQSVPSATLLPCVAELPAGWSYGGSEIASGRARFWLASDRAGLQAVEVTLTSACRIAGAVDVTNATDEGGVQVYLHEFSLHPFSANRYFVFPGGCVTYRYRFDPAADPVLALEADEALTFGPRGDVVRKVRRELGLTLCGAGAPRCTGDA